MALNLLALAAAFALQPVGTFHGDETIARDGERWLALRTDGPPALVATTARVKAVNDPVEDDEHGRSGREVASGVEGAEWLLRGGTLRAGPVVPATGDAPDRALPEPGRPALLRLGARTYRLSLDCGPTPASPASCALRLAEGGRAQTLLRVAASRGDDGRLQLGDDAGPVLLFAGDLDRDGRLDLLLDTTDHYNLSQPVLLLSSQATPRELVRAVATHRSTGC